MSQTPERVFRIGMVTASVFARKFERSGEPERTVRSVSVQKRYIDNGRNQVQHLIRTERIAASHRVYATGHAAPPAYGSRDRK